MSAINSGKVVIGGLLAGLVMNVLDIANGMLVMGGEFRSNAQRLGLDPAQMESASGMATWITIDFLMGILVVWTYAAMRPRFGPGPSTAVKAALVPWLSVGLILFGLTHGGLLTMSIWVKMSAISLVIMTTSSVAGAWAYKE